VVQGLANNSLTTKDTWKQVAKETTVALLNATIITLLVYIYNFVVFGGAATVTYAVSLSLFCVVMFASLFGAMVPLIMERLKIDPAIATGPFVTIINDIVGMLIYMAITAVLA
jgi:magnesium transporter